MNFVCQDPRAGCCKPLTASLLEFDSQWLSPTDSPAIPVEQDQGRDSHKVTHNVAGHWLSLLGSFPTRGTRDSEETSLHGAHWAGRGAVWSM